MKVLMCCLGNICRSPMAEIVLKQKVKQHNLESKIEFVDSCGTAAYHVGEEPDYRTTKCCKQHYGKDLVVDHRGRQLHESDFKNFDFIFVMDEDNYETAMKRFNKAKQSNPSCEKWAQLKMLAEYDTDEKKKEKIVHDPWYGDMDNFEHVFQQVNRCLDGFLKQQRIL